MEHPIPQQCHTKENILRNTLFRNLLNMLRNGWFRNMYTPQKNTLQNTMFRNSIRSHPNLPLTTLRYYYSAVPRTCSCPLPPTTPTAAERPQSCTAPHRHLHLSCFCTTPPPPFHCSITSKISRLKQSLHKGKV